jgi:sec-independent protein translocase protein TatA
MGISIGHILLVLIIVFVLFGAGKLPQVMAELARGLKAFKKGIDEETDNGKDIPSQLHSMAQTIEESEKEIVHLEQKSKASGQGEENTSKNKKPVDKKPIKKTSEQGKKSVPASSRSSASKKDAVKGSKNEETKKRADSPSKSKKKNPASAKTSRS